MSENDKSSESKVRDYLQWLDDPTALVDSETVRRLEEQLSVEKDPIRRLTIAVQLVNARTPAPEDLRRGFIESAADYAANSAIPAEAFRQLGVPQSDLREAGIASLSRSRPNSGRATKRRVTVEQICAQMPQRPVTIREVIDLTGAAPMTVRKAINEMLTSGIIQSVGPDPDFNGRGKAPRRFARTQLRSSEHTVGPDLDSA